MPSAATRWMALRPDVLPHHEQVSRIAGRDRIIVGARAGQELDRRGHVVRVARVEPERLLEQLRHRRHDAVAGEVEPVREPAVLDQEAHELLGQRNVPARLEDRGRIEAGPDGERLAVGAIRPLDRCGVLVVVVRTLALSAFGIESECSPSSRPSARGTPGCCRASSQLDRVGRRAALAVDRRVAVHGPDQPAPDLAGRR